jgi:ABC-type dipeptide/oligopeptide/nickel transport system permease subunit
MTQRVFRTICCGILGIVFAVGLFAEGFTHYPYALQFREFPNAAPSSMHWLGTDGLGRDFFARVIYGTRVSLLLAPAAALLATAIAAVLGGVAGLRGGWLETLILATADLSMSLPLLFVLIALRAFLPLDVSPVLASGYSNSQMLFRQVIPHLRPIFLAQFWISIPLFILTEATLSMLGLGVMEPLPSWGNLLRGSEDFSAMSANPWRLVPLFLLVLTVICFQFVLPSSEELT